MRQFTHIVTGLEMSNFRVHGMVCDAGGANVRLYKLLRKQADPGPTTGKLDDSIVAIPNPVDPNRHIWVYHCSAHVLKAVRLQLYQSREGGSKCFYKDINKTIFGWLTTQNSYERDEARSTRLTDLNIDCVWPDGYNAMNVSGAKRVFF